MILVIDNYDSFVYNLARYFQLSGKDTDVRRNDRLTLDDVMQGDYEAIVISPGPCAPAQSGISTNIVRTMSSTTPILGICLGHQCIGEAYGGKTLRSPIPMHGKASTVKHNGQGIFQGVPSPLAAGRYHSLRADIPDDSPLSVTARTEEGDIMAFQHISDPVYGLQFHPESILTEHGLDLVKNFVRLSDQFRHNRAA